jgi:hypothetical protein
MFRSLEDRRAYMREWQKNFRITNPEYYRKQYEKHRHKRIAESQNWYRANCTGGFEKKLRSLLYKARQRAKQKGIEFSVSAKDFKHTTHCPLLKTELCFTNSRHDKGSSPSIDRIDPSKGYVPGNVWIISARANQIKNNATLGELRQIAKNLAAETKRRGIQT